MDEDASRLLELGYEQELRRDLHGLENVALGFATISPVVGLYAVVLIGTVVAGPAWVWVLPVVLAGQCTVLAVYSELAAEFPLTGGPYQWSRRLLGWAYGWFNGWMAVCAYAVANTTIAYLGAPWALTVAGIEATSSSIVITAMVLVLVCALVGAGGIHVLKRVIEAGILAEATAAVGIGLALLLVFREQDLSIVTETLGAEARSGGSVGAALLAALAVGGWVFIGFDACVAGAEETRDAARHVPRALWVALLTVGALVMLNAVAAALAHPDPGAIVRGDDRDPLTTAVVNSFGSWAAKPFATLVLVAFLSCGMASQSLTARTLYSMARDGALPASRALRRVDRRGSPLAATVVTAAVACGGLLLAVDATAIGTLIVFGTAAIYVSFFLVALAALVARVRGSWQPQGHVQLGRAGLVLNAVAVAWLAFETVNIAWPRESIAPPGAPFYQVWAAPLVLLLITATGIAYYSARAPKAVSLSTSQPAREVVNRSSTVPDRSR